jgi:extracellular factor (EF) 3-hydroxypalmitic acid methyl ester biosynthesis protein
MTQMNSGSAPGLGVGPTLDPDLPSHLASVDADLFETLEGMAPRLRSRDIREVALSIDTAISLLFSVREARGGDWEAIAARLRDGAFFASLLADPFTNHAFRRPRGYPGDAPLIDFIYGCGESGRAIAEASDVGRRIYRHNWTVPACQAVRERRCIAADFLACATIEVNRPRILSIAAGHARELDVLPGLLDACTEFVALDQDAESPGTLKATHPGVDTISAGVRGIVHDRFDTARFDIVYSLGLFDYLSDQVAIRLLRAISQAGPPHLRILIGNFVPEARDVGYMEAFMRWNLTYRTPAQMSELAQAAAPNRSARVFRDHSRQIAYLEIGPDCSENGAIRPLTLEPITS